METKMDKSELIEKLKTILASSFSLYLKAHNYHWNVTGPNFAEYHGFFADYYTAVHESVDVYAELIRVLNAFAPGSFARFSELTKISDEIAIPSSKFMFVRLASDNALMLDELRTAHMMADAMGEIGVSATLETQIQFHEKMQWQLTAFTE
jgi:starvation-inducible DNA-binding protein